VWSWGNGYRKHDILTEKDATPRIIRHIHETFDRFVTERGKERFAEKTPNNAMRTRFIRAVYPDARFILIIRDGRSVINSTGKILEKGAPVERIWRRAKRTRLRDWPAQAPMAVSMLVRRLLKKPIRYWGPRAPGWQSWLKAGDPPPVILAKQWAGTLLPGYRHALEEPESFYIMRYEDMISQPRRVLTEVAEFAQLTYPEQFVEDTVSRLDPTRAELWRTEIPRETLDLVRPHLEPALNELGYEW
jgi:hypothetical protein